MNRQPRLLFVSPRFLFPADSGGKIRTSQILRHLKGGAFRVELLSAAAPGEAERYAADIAKVCDEFRTWPAVAASRWRQARHLLSSLPIPVAADRSRAGRAAVAAALGSAPEVVVFDFLHSAVLAPARSDVPCVLFTHNVEAEIFARHQETAAGVLMRALWANQYRRMVAFERRTLQRFDRVIAVSDRDRAKFAAEYGATHVATIPTGVDLDFFAYTAPADKQRVVFTGSMDWIANADAMDYFMDDIWPLIVRAVPQATMTVIGRAPPARLVAKARERQLNWQFTGFVDDVRPHARGCEAYVIPLRVGGGTRIKAFEAMAMGIPVVSTTIGMEGLAVEDGKHFLRADTAQAFADSVIRLLRDPAARTAQAAAARAHVEEHFSNKYVARVFEQICLDAWRAHRTHAPVPALAH